MREVLRNTYGKRVSLKKVARLMRENGLNARRRRKCIPTTNSNHGLPVCENVLNRKFQAETAGAKWVLSDPYGVCHYVSTCPGRVALPDGGVGLV
ncbi:MAG: IS3 family transposase [Treponema sp.]|nr:IS3 family transposase [Treponema sp.]